MHPFCSGFDRPLLPANTGQARPILLDAGHRIVPMRRLIGVVLLLLLAGCGGRAPASPSAVGLAGIWSGTITTTVTGDDGPADSYTCAQTWQVEQGDGTHFTGTWTTSGGFCHQGGAVDGTLAPDGHVTFQIQTQDLPPESSCTVTSGGDTFAGTVVAGTLTATASDAGFCRDGTATFSAQRSRTIRLTRE